MGWDLELRPWVWLTFWRFSTSFTIMKASTNLGIESSFEVTGELGTFWHALFEVRKDFERGEA